MKTNVLKMKALEEDLNKPMDMATAFVEGFYLFFQRNVSWGYQVTF